MRIDIKILLTVVFTALMSCNSSKVEPDGDQNMEAVFYASVAEAESVKTRYDSVYINSEKYNQNFYLELSTTEENNEPFTEGGIYRIPSGYEGRLTPINPANTLNWHDLTTDHTFYGWTIPWNDNFYSESVNSNSIPVTFDDSSETNFSIVHNNSVYETFVGAKSLPFSYANHGKYVDLTFFHLVSKIKIGIFQLTEASGAIQRNLKAEITFINMPTSGTFYPHPAGGKQRPYIQPDTPNPNDGITYYISNNPREDQSDIFYISPETNFAEVDFQIKLKDAKYKDYDTYYGSFGAVEFVRNNPPQDFDSSTGGDTKILHAGEEMTLNINLIPGKGPGLRLVIDKWNTEEPQEAKYHSYPGIYSQAELNQLLVGFLSQKIVDGVVSVEDIERLFATYGITLEDIMYFPLYENVDITVNPGSIFGGFGGNFFPVWKDYILDGQGHTITMKTNSNQWFEGTAYFNIGPARDVYLTDPSGEYSIYIDEQGYVWTYDITTNTYNKTSNQLTSLEGKYEKDRPAYSFNINAKTGKVEYASYYNLQPGLNT